MIYKMIRNVIAVRKNLHDWKIGPTPNWFFCNSVDSVLHSFFHCSKTKYFIKQIETFLGKKFKLNAYRMIFGTNYKVGNYASILGIFLWSKAIRVTWTTRRLLVEGKPCNDMAMLFKNYANSRVSKGLLLRAMTPLKLHISYENRRLKIAPKSSDKHKGVDLPACSCGDQALSTGLGYIKLLLNIFKSIH